MANTKNHSIKREEAFRYVIKSLKEGKRVVSIARKLHKSDATIYLWIKEAGLTMDSIRQMIKDGFSTDEILKRSLFNSIPDMASVTTKSFPSREEKAVKGGATGNTSKEIAWMIALADSYEEAAQHLRLTVKALGGA